MINNLIGRAFDFTSAGVLTGVAAYSILLAILFYVFWIGFSIAIYILSSLGLFTIAKRRGLRLYGMAWVPIGSYWLLGSIGDHYVRTVKGKKSSLRIWLLVLEIVLVLLVWADVIMISLSAIFLSVSAENSQGVTLAGVSALLIGLTVVLTTVVMVQEYISYYRLYKSTRPDKATLFIVLSILLPLTIPFFVFACRKYDDGMTPPVETEAELPPQLPEE